MNRKKYYLRPDGISLVELLMALSIIAVLASAAALSFRSSIAQAELQQAADRFSADLRWVREQAVNEQQTYSVMIDTSNRSYQAVGVKNLVNDRDISVNLAAPPYRLSSLVAFPEGTNVVTFDARGYASPAGDIILRRGAKQITIKIHEIGQIEQTK